MTPEETRKTAGSASGVQNRTSCSPSAETSLTFVSLVSGLVTQIILKTDVDMQPRGAANNCQAEATAACAGMLTARGDRRHKDLHSQHLLEQTAKGTGWMGASCSVSAHTVHSASFSLTDPPGFPLRYLLMVAWLQ